MKANERNSDICDVLYFSFDRNEDQVQKRVKSLETALRTHGINCIMTEDHGPNEASYSRIDSARCVFFFLSSSYIKRVAGRGDQGMTDVCRREFDYSVLKRGIHNMVPVALEPNLLDSSEWKGTLGAALSSCSKIFDFTQDEMLSTLVREIRTILNPNFAENDFEQKIRLKEGYYVGEVDSNKLPHGQGVLKYDNKAVFEGNFKHGERDGLGKYIFPNGMIYEGDWKRDKKQGKGKLIQKNDDYYEGEFYNNEKNGMGKSAIGGSVHTGLYKNGKMEGQGTLIFENGNEYTGLFFNNAMHEKGCMIFKQLGTYTGDFFLNRRHGKGRMDFDPRTMSDPSRGNESQDFYDGEWEDDLRKGRGLRQFANGDRYQGEWENDEMHGSGKTVFHNGDVYEGNYFEGRKSGKGKYTYSNGNIYEGDFKNDKRHGKGLLIYKLGQVKTYKGQFINNQRCGQGTAEFANGLIYSGEWEHNSIHGKGQLDFSKCSNKCIAETLGSTNVKTGFFRRNIRLVNVEYSGNTCISSEIVQTDKRSKSAVVTFGDETE